jgi:iron complex outermembrane recepter protein
MKRWAAWPLSLVPTCCDLFEKTVMAKKLSSVSSAALLLCSGLAATCAQAQTSPAVLPAVTVESSSQQPDVGGFGDVPAREVPLSVTVIDAQTLADIGAKRVSDAARLDASVADSYNSPAYWDILSMRGFTLDNRYNYRRDGLPINAETMIPLDNIERIEMLKGTSGMQAGTSSPGGLVNHVVKRPPSATDKAVRSVSVTFGSASNAEVALDLGGRFGQQSEWGYRINAAAEHLDPYTRNSTGQRRSVSVAMDWRISRDTLLEWEFAHATRQQYGVNGYSLLGSQLPSPVDPRVNLTAQPWSVPGQFVANTGSVRLQQALANGWTWKTQYGAQRLRTDDRLAFAYGCSDGQTYYSDRFCPNGNFDLYDFRSDNERRLSDALLTELSGQLRVGDFTHDLQLSLLRQRQLDRMPPLQAYNYAGWGNIDGTGDTFADPTPSYANTNRSEYATEWSIKNRIRWGTASSIWAGVRHTRYDRSSQRNDSPETSAVHNRGHITTPWLAVSTRWHDADWYASHGHGAEVFVAPNSPIYSNAGQQLGVARSRQSELGVRAVSGAWQWQAALFHIERPLAIDHASDTDLQRAIDGRQVHTGLEGSLQWKQGVWSAGVSVQWLRARLQGLSLDPSLNGMRPLNVPAHTMRAFVEQRLTSIPGARWTVRMSHEGRRAVTQDGSLELPSWTTLDAALHWDKSAAQGGGLATWSLGIDNISDKRYWRESPKMFGHHYLYPGAPRTWRLGMSTSF